jgi:hypothetical protein
VPFFCPLDGTAVCFCCFSDSGNAPSGALFGKSLLGRGRVRGGGQWSGEEPGKTTFMTILSGSEDESLDLLVRLVIIGPGFFCQKEGFVNLTNPIPIVPPKTGFSAAVS